MEQTEQDKAVRLAGAFVLEAMSGYINDIRAAAYPHTPEQIGGAPYIYFLKTCDDAKAGLDRGESPLETARLAISQLEEFLSSFEDKKSAVYIRFEAKKRVADRLL